ncbi:MAG: Coenzyme F420 hydrogenase/dehydrogenase, beta subunit C-terminal domain [Candidatus Aureabacteria bacterium]|nr:Coenzyme F420 hydrogenase/dehydrogenase, beta subunit C-terminal domain [Candidatus Auribacterota bacterium]MCK5160214.1 Coenzyme F420 hydrogenase/dehydrogenase, beta subunit C-terminal domain [Candidatus Auribacterota bacterium]
MKILDNKQNVDVLSSDVIKKGLCSICGTCIGICPLNCLGINNHTLEPIKVNDKCNNCGLCLKVCPGYNIDYPNLYKTVFGSMLETRQHYGIYRKCFYAKAKNINIDSCASGGVTSGLAKFLLDEKIVKGVILAGYSEQKPWVPEGKLVFNGEDIIKNSGSKYVCIPVNSLLKKIKTLEGKYAVIGVPCAIESVRKLQDISSIFRQKILLTLGIFCGINVKQTVTEKLLREQKINKATIKKYSNRDKINGYQTKIILADGRVKQINELWGQRPHILLSPYYSPLRCQLCINHTNEFADIAIGDTWDKHGDLNLVLARTQIGEIMLEKFKTAGHLYTEKAEFYHAKVIANKKIRTAMFLRYHKNREALHEYRVYVEEITKNMKWATRGKFLCLFFVIIFKFPLFKFLYCNLLWKLKIAFPLSKRYYSKWENIIIFSKKHN